MIGAIGSLVSGIGINLLSDRLIKKFSALKDQKAVQHLTNTLREWETQFELEHDVTIVTKGDSTIPESSKFLII